MFRDHRAKWLGRLAEYIPLEPGVSQTYAEYTALYRMRRGWLTTLEVSSIEHAVAERLKDASIARCLQEFVIDTGGMEEFDDFDQLDTSVLRVLVASPWLGSVRRFRYGSLRSDEMNPQLLEHGELYEPAHAWGDQIVKLVAKMPALEELRLLAVIGNSTDLFRLPIYGRIHTLQLYHLHDYRLDELARNPTARNLRRLWIMPHAVHPLCDSNLPKADALAFIRSPATAKLRELRLRIRRRRRGYRGGHFDRIAGAARSPRPPARVHPGCRSVRSGEMLRFASIAEARPGRNQLSPLGIQALSGLRAGGTDSRLSAGTGGGWGVCESVPVRWGLGVKP